MFYASRTGRVPSVLSKSKQGRVGDSVIGGVFWDGWRKVKSGYIPKGLKNIQF